MADRASDQEEAVKLIRDGTIVGPDGTEVDLRTEDNEVWVTVRGDSDKRVEELVAAILSGDVEGQQ